MEARGGGWREASADRLMESEAHGATLTDKSIMIASSAGFHPPTAGSMVKRGLRGVASLAAPEIGETELLLRVTKGVKVADGGRGTSVDRAPPSRGIGCSYGRANFYFRDMIGATGSSTGLA